MDPMTNKEYLIGIADAITSACEKGELLQMTQLLAIAELLNRIAEEL